MDRKSLDIILLAAKEAELTTEELDRLIITGEAERILQDVTGGAEGAAL